MNNANNMKNELGKFYGEYLVVAYTNYRVPSNGCVIWECRCKYCGTKRYINGNHLRFGQVGKCPVCNPKKRR